MINSNAYTPGTYPLEIKGTIQGYPDQANSYTFYVTLAETCSSATVLVPTLNGAWTQSITDSISIFASYAASDPRCSIEYACVPQESGLDLCAIGTLDSSTGEFVLPGSDLNSYPPGTYPVEIQGFITGYPS